MADNVTANAGSGGAVFATDDIGGVHHTRVKIEHGADGSATDVSTASPLPVGGGVAHDAADAGNPIKVGFKAINALPTAVANADRTDGVADLFGRQLIASIDPAQQVSKSVSQTSQQTGTDVWSPASGKRIAITHLIIGTFGSTAARLILWFGANADTTYTAGTDQLVVAQSFAPSTLGYPGLVLQPATPIFCTTADFELHVTTDAALSFDISVYGYEW
jgi:hypothetical protein